MMRYLRLVKQTMDHFPSVKMIQVARGQNWHAESLATLMSSSTEGIPRLIKVELVAEPSFSAGVGVSGGNGQAILDGSNHQVPI